MRKLVLYIKLWDSDEVIEETFTYKKTDKDLDVKLAHFVSLIFNQFYDEGFHVKEITFSEITWFTKEAVRLHKEAPKGGKRLPDGRFIELKKKITAKE